LITLIRDHIKRLITLISDHIKRLITLIRDHIKRLITLISDHIKQLITLIRDHIKRLITLISDHIKRLSLYINEWITWNFLLKFIAMHSTFFWHSKKHWNTDVKFTKLQIFPPVLTTLSYRHEAKNGSNILLDLFNHWKMFQ
jgi:hypothetical protein